MKRALFTPPPTQNPRDRLKQLLPWLGLACGFLLLGLLFTCAKTKLGWYIFCIYPSAALFAAMAFRSMLEHQPEDFRVGALIIAFAALFSCSVMNVREVVRIPDQSVSALTTLLADGTHYEQAHFYIANQDNNSWNGSGWTQAQVMEAEWLADCAPRSGGISAFAEDPGSYLIASNARTEDFSAYELICRSEAYSLYHHKTRNQLNCNQHICDMQANVVAVASKSRFAV